LLYERALQTAGRNLEYGEVIPPALLPDFMAARLLPHQKVASRIVVMGSLSSYISVILCMMSKRRYFTLAKTLLDFLSQRR
jgi:hypothetical protein